MFQVWAHVNPSSWLSWMRHKERPKTYKFKLQRRNTDRHLVRAPDALVQLTGNHINPCAWSVSTTLQVVCNLASSTITFSIVCHAKCLTCSCTKRWSATEENSGFQSYEVQNTRKKLRNSDVCTICGYTYMGTIEQKTIESPSWSVSSRASVLADSRRLLCATKPIQRDQLLCDLADTHRSYTRNKANKKANKVLHHVSAT